MDSFARAIFFIGVVVSVVPAREGLSASRYPGCFLTLTSTLRKDF
jgi:hypothetical protein